MGYIKIKNESCHFLEMPTICDKQCKWCGKTIKAGKQHLWSASVSGEYCSLSHVKQAFKANKGL